MDANQLLEEYRKGRRDFSGIKLTNANLSGILLEGAVFKNCNLSDTHFDHSDLSGADFSNCHMTRCSFFGAILKKTNFEDADLSYSTLKNAYFENTRLGRANLMWAHLCESDLARSSIENANLTWSCLIGSNLSEDQIKSIPEATLTTISMTKQPSGQKTAYASQQSMTAGISGYGGGKDETALYTNPQPKEKKKQDWC